MTKKKDSLSSLQKKVKDIITEAFGFSKQGLQYEVSTRGDRRFSALNAMFRGGRFAGRTIEDVYQRTLKGSGKGLPPAAILPGVAVVTLATVVLQREA